MTATKRESPYRTFIVIEIGEGMSDTYFVDTPEEIEEARRALLDCELEHEEVWVTPTDEYSPDAFKNGKVFFAD